jgi:alanyl-tRNA synthetase
MSEINNVSSVSSRVDYSASNVNTSSAASNESQVNNSSNINSVSATEDSKKTDNTEKPEEPKDKDKTEKNKEKEELQKQIEELKKQLEELKKKLQEQQKTQENCGKPEGAQQSPQAQQAPQSQQPDQNQNDPNQLILQDIIQVLEAEKNGDIGVQQSVNKLKQDYMMVKSMNIPLKPEVDQTAQQIIQKYGGQGFGVNPLAGNQLASGLNPTQAVNQVNNVQQPQTQGINF